MCVCVCGSDGAAAVPVVVVVVVVDPSMLLIEGKKTKCLCYYFVVSFEAQGVFWVCAIAMTRNEMQDIWD